MPLRIYHEQRTSAGALCPGHYRYDCFFPEAEAAFDMVGTLMLQSTVTSRLLWHAICKASFAALDQGSACATHALAGVAYLVCGRW